MKDHIKKIIVTKAGTCSRRELENNLIDELGTQRRDIKLLLRWWFSDVSKKKKFYKNVDKMSLLKCLTPYNVPKLNSKFS